MIFLKTIEKSKLRHLKNILLLLGIFTPVTINLIFIFQYSVNTIFLDAWDVMFPLVMSTIENNAIPIEQLFSQRNESFLVFPSLIMLGIALATNYNTFFDSIAAWIILLGCLFVIWRLLLKTDFPLWLLVPSSWLLFSLLSYHSLIFGFSGVHWFFSILSFLGGIYFLTRLDESRFFIIPTIALGFVSTFSYITGILVWPIFFLTFIHVKKDRWKLLFILTLSSIVAYTLFFYNWIYPTHLADRVLKSSANPFEFLIYIPSYLGNGMGIVISELIGKTQASVIAGLIILIIFFILMVFSLKFKIYLKIIPWIQISFFAILVTILTSAGRNELGIGQSLSSRYAIFPNLFLVGMVILSYAVLSYLIHKKQSKQKLWKLLGLILVGLLIIFVTSSNVKGIIGGEQFHQRFYDGTICLVNYEFSSDNCIGKIGINNRENAKILEKYNMGPFADPKFIKYENMEIYQIMQQYPNRLDLQEEFPEAKNGNLTKISSWVNSTIENIPSDISNIPNHKFANLGIMNDQILLQNNNSTIPKTSKVSLKGWALSDDKGPVDFVYIYVDGIPFSLLEYGQYRPDLVKHFGKNTYRFAGYTADLSFDNFQLGCHEIDILLFYNSKITKIFANNTICLFEES